MILRKTSVQNHIQQRLVHLDATVIFDKTELAKAIHEETDPGSSGSDHFSQSFLRYLGDQSLRIARLAKLRHQEKNARQALFAGVEELVDKIGLRANAACQKKLQEQVGEVMLLVHHADHFPARNLESGACGRGDNRSQSQPGSRCKCLFSHKITRGEKRQSGFLTRGRDDCDFGSPLLKIENKVGWFPL